MFVWGDTLFSTHHLVTYLLLRQTWWQLSYRALKTPPLFMQSMVALMYCAFVTPISRFWCCLTVVCGNRLRPNGHLHNTVIFIVVNLEIPSMYATLLWIGTAVVVVSAMRCGAVGAKDGAGFNLTSICCWKALATFLCPLRQDLHKHVC